MTGQQMRALRAERFAAIAVAALVVFAAACGRHTPESKPQPTKPDLSAGPIYVVHDTMIDAAFDAAGVAAPIQQATLSTRLMGTVTDVLVREGDRVTAGQLLVRIDARDLSAKSAQVAASVAEAEAMHHDAIAQANRIRALYADSAATRAQLDAAETGLARAEAGLKVAQAAAAELGAVSSYSGLRAPFAGIVTKRFADPGALAAPGAPLVTVQDVSTLRISASTTPAIARGLHRGQTLTALVEGMPVRVAIEGVVPALAGNLYTINALVPNADLALLAGSRATLAVPTGQRRVLVAPTLGVVREGDLTGVTLRTAQGDDRRWVRLGRALGDMIEVTAGLQAGDRIVVPEARVASRMDRIEDSDGTSTDSLKRPSGRLWKASVGANAKTASLTNADCSSTSTPPPPTSQFSIDRRGAEVAENCSRRFSATSAPLRSGFFCFSFRDPFGCVQPGAPRVRN